MPIPLCFVNVPSNARLQVIAKGEKEFYALCFKRTNDSEEKAYLRICPFSGQVITGIIKFPMITHSVWQYKEKGWPLPSIPTGTAWHRASLNVCIPKCKDVRVRAFYKEWNPLVYATKKESLHYLIWANVDGEDCYESTHDRTVFTCDTLEPLLLVDNPPPI